jgi:hypothetical protein
MEQPKGRERVGVRVKRVRWRTDHALYEWLGKITLWRGVRDDVALQSGAPLNPSGEGRIEREETPLLPTDICRFRNPATRVYRALMDTPTNATLPQPGPDQVARQRGAPPGNQNARNTASTPRPSHPRNRKSCKKLKN